MALPMDPEYREALLEAVPEIYYAPEHYMSYPMCSCSASRARQYSLRAAALFPVPVLVMRPICGLQGWSRKRGSSDAY